MAASNSKPNTSTTPLGLRDPSRRNLDSTRVKYKVFFEKYGAETGGEYSLVRCTTAPGGGTPLHYHNSYREELTALDGTLGVVIGDETKNFQPGETAVIPIGTKHRFFNDTDQVIEFRARIVPAHAGFEQCIYIAHGLEEDGQCDEKGVPKNFVHLCLLADLGDMKFPGMMALLGPLAKAVAAYGRWTGEEERLLKKYWY
jgi:quercetin dioxygenase-like cupin family protein